LCFASSAVNIGVTLLLFFLARVDRVLSSSVREQTIGIKKELFNLAVPAIVGQAIDPVAQLLETAYVGRLGIFPFSLFGISWTSVLILFSCVIHSLHNTLLQFSG
jgi:hypothetical protein